MPRLIDNGALQQLKAQLEGEADRLNRQNLARIQRIAAARRAALPPAPRQSGPDKQKTPEVPASEVFTDRNSGLGSNGGRYTECA